MRGGATADTLKRELRTGGGLSDPYRTRDANDVMRAVAHTQRTRGGRSWHWHTLIERETRTTGDAGTGTHSANARHQREVA